MATERNVVDFKIHNLTEEQFQELKAQGKIDPNAVYCTPDESLKRNQITNCITEIPQDIKLELADGVLTLKAGSKVYVPNGSGIFDTYTIPDDLTYTRSGTDTLFLFIRTDTHTIDIAGLNAVSSGSTDSLAGTTYHTWYDTANNLIKRYTTDTSTTNRYNSLPIAIIKVGETQIESIDQVFNGFGYIGSTVFVLPGVKGLIPNGRNEDGTLKSNLVTSNKVLTNTYTGTNSNLYFGFVNNAVYFQSGASISYNAAANTTTWNTAIIAKTNATSGKITEFESKPTFHAVDYSDFENTVEEINSSISAVDSSAVHKTGKEIIGGEKEFTATISSNKSVSAPVIKNDNGTQLWLFDYNLDSTSRYKGGFLFRCLKTDGTWIDFVGNNSGLLTWQDNQLATMPNYSAGVAFTLNSTTSYTAPKDGFVFIYTGRGKDQYANIKIDGTQVGSSIAYYTNIQYFFPVAKGTVISTNYATIESARFYPLKGAI